MSFSKRAAALLLALMIVISVFSLTASADGGIIYAGIGFVNASGLNLRQSPSVDAPILATANSGECVVVISQEGEWYHVLYNLMEGYMNAAYLRVSGVENAELGYGSCVGYAINLRSGPSTDDPIVGTAGLNDRFYIIGLNQGWFKVLRDEQTCYIRSDFVSLEEIPYENRASQNQPRFYRGGASLGTTPSAAAVDSTPAYTPAATYGSANGSQIVATAQLYLGAPYVYGGASPEGFDCSGFVYYVFNSLGYSIGRTPDAQYSAGTPVDYYNLQPGDIVLFAGTVGGGISHTGIYAGNGQFIHSPNSRSVVSYSDLTSGCWNEHFFCGIRVA